MNLNYEKITSISNNNRRNYGRNYVFFIKNGEPLITIGPHWPFSVFMVIIMIISGIFLAEYTTKEISFVLYITSYFLTFFCTVSFVFTTFVNQGICSQKLMENSHLDIEDCIHQFCEKCNICKREKRAMHCNICDVCVAKWDHHCIWFSKCVGEGNILYFRFFVFVVIFLMLFSLVLNIHNLQV